MISVVKPDWDAPKNVVAFTTTRSGGISDGSYQALNLGDHVEDDPVKVQHNRQQLVSELSLPSQPTWLKQVHGTNILNLTEPITDQIEADGTQTETKGIVCAVMTADCLPLFLTNTAGTKVAVLHVGWQGMANGMIEAGIKAFNQSSEQIIAWAGPSIGPNTFEIGLEVKAKLGGSEDCYKKISKNKVLANLYKLTQQRLSKLGVANYSHSEHCTYQDQELFYSYRRDGVTGRQASIIYLK